LQLHVDSDTIIYTVFYYDIMKGYGFMNVLSQRLSMLLLSAVLLFGCVQLSFAAEAAQAAEEATAGGCHADQ
jgi:hypothetical protein